jgi:hypothetical protein
MPSCEPIGESNCERAVLAGQTLPARQHHPHSQFNLCNLVRARLLADFSYHPFGLHLTAGPWRKDRQGQHEVEIVIGSNPIEALEPAAITAVNDYILPAWPLEAANGLHAGSAGAQAISRSPVINVAREQAERTVIAVLRAGSRWTDKTMAMPALERCLCRGPLLALPAWTGRRLLLPGWSVTVCFSQCWISSFRFDRWDIISRIEGATTVAARRTRSIVGVEYGCLHIKQAPF